MQRLLPWAGELPRDTVKKINSINYVILNLKRYLQNNNIKYFYTRKKRFKFHFDANKRNNKNLLTSLKNQEFSLYLFPDNLYKKN